MKNIVFFFTLLMLVACTDETEMLQDKHEVSRITMTAEDFVIEKSARTSFDITETGAKFTWAAQDTVGIFPDKGFQGYFPMIEGAGTKTASFTGGGWTLKSASDYVAYYPFIRSMEVDKTAIPVFYEGQTQTGNASTAHLGKYDYMAAAARTPEEGNVNFRFEHLGCLVELNMIIPEPGTYDSLTLHCNDTVFVTQGTINLTSPSPSISGVKERTRDMTVYLKNFTTTEANTAVKIYFMATPVDLLGKYIYVKINSDQTSYAGTFKGKNWQAGCAYSVALNLYESNESSDSRWVDLGLPSTVMWAAHNVGAFSPEDNGNYFEWGKIYEKNYSLRNNNTPKVLEMDCISGREKYDVATYKWGKPARIPTKEEIQELIDVCTHEVTLKNGKYGIVVTGPSGNSIYFPMTGEPNRNSGTVYDGSYWSATPYNTDNEISYCLHFSVTTRHLELSYASFSNGLSVRPVKGVNLFVPVAVTGDYVDLKSNSVQVTAHFSNVPQNASCGIEYVFLSNTNKIFSKSVPCNAAGDYTVLLTDLADDMAYRYRAYIKWDDRVIYGEFKDFVTLKSNEPVGQWVDLGLPSGIKWASRNVGASTPDDYGDYFCWGEISTKNFYGEDNCSTYGKYIGDISGNSRYDAARALWGDSARIPTSADIDELLQYCSFFNDSYNGVDGITAIGPNGHDIFFPFAGYQYGHYLNPTTNNGANHYGFYWKSSPNDEFSSLGVTISDYSNECNPSSCYYRYYGISIRPVRD